MFIEYCRRAYGFLGRKRENHGRELALIGARQRRQSQRERYRQVHDEMRARLGLSPIVWRD